jgi:hypothetical protein
VAQKAIVYLKENGEFTPAGSAYANGVINVRYTDVTIEGNNAVIVGTNNDGYRLFRAYASASSIFRLKNLTIRDVSATKSSNSGAAIFFGGSLLDIENCRFINNSSAISYAGVIESRLSASKIVVRNSIFSGNKVTSATSGGGVIAHAGGDGTSIGGGSLIIDGCIFNNNSNDVTGTVSGSVICAAKNTANSYLSNISITNSTFYQNGKSGATNASAAAIYLVTPMGNGTAHTETVLANNTFYGNHTGVLYAESKYYDLKLVNNVIVGTLAGTDFGINTGVQTTAERTPIVAKSNVIIAKTALGANVDEDLSIGNTLTSNATQANIDNLYLASTLTTPETGVPYLPITDPASPLIDKGLDSYTGVIVPSKDITGANRGDGNRTGNGYDIGAYEYFATAAPIWTGDNADSNWNNPANWENGVVPEKIDNVYIPVTSNIPTIPTGTKVNTITFEQGAEANLAGTLTATEAIKVDYTVEDERWYSIGFPFDIAKVYSHDFATHEDWDPELLPYRETVYENGFYGDFWLKEYDPSLADHFAYTQAINAGTGYIIQFPEWFDGTKITFISEANQTLDKDAMDDLPVISSNYQLVPNPSLKKITLVSSGGNYYYPFKHNSGDNGAYELLTSGNATLLPFEAVITVSRPEAASSSMPAFISLGTNNPTGFERPALANDPVVAIRYYTIQGQEVQKPVANGVYIVRKVYESKKEEVAKIIYTQK